MHILSKWATLKINRVTNNRSESGPVVMGDDLCSQVSSSYLDG